jgi:hypothetical protein
VLESILTGLSLGQAAAEPPKTLIAYLAAAPHTDPVTVRIGIRNTLKGHKEDGECQTMAGQAGERGTRRMTQILDAWDKIWAAAKNF